MGFKKSDNPYSPKGIIGNFEIQIQILTFKFTKGPSDFT